MKARKTYEKPKLGRFKIRPEDSVLQYCREILGPTGETPADCDAIAPVNYPS